MLRLAADTLEAPDPSGVSAKELKLVKVCRRAVARAVDWTAFDWYWFEGEREWDRRDRSLAEIYNGIKTSRTVLTALKREVLGRDGFRCRYCQLRVISSPTMDKLEKALPDALPAGDKAFQCHPMQCVLRLTWDHVKARAAGGTNDASNIVVSCARAITTRAR